MMIGQDELIIDAPVSARLFSATDAIQAFYLKVNSKARRLKKIRSVQIISRPQLTTLGIGSAACTFSGGVDSFYSALSHRHELRYLTVANGFDIPLANEGLWNKVIPRLRVAAERIGLPLIEVTTNLRYFADPIMDWGDYHGVATAVLGILLSEQISAFYLPATYSHPHVFVCGSHPDLDMHFSTEWVRIIHDAVAVRRIDKIGAIAGNPIVQDTIRVCWENPDSAYNCCHCQKCMRSMAEFMIYGVLDKCRTFPEPLNLEALAAIKLKFSAIAVFYIEALAVARERGALPELCAALEKVVSRYKDAPLAH